MIDLHGKMGHENSSRLGFTRRAVVVLSLVVASIVFVTAVRVRAQRQAPQNPEANSDPNSNPAIAKELRLKITAPFTIATVGDIIEPQPVASHDPAYLRLINIIRNADVGFANEESTMVDVSHFPGPFGDITATPELAKVIKDMGITIVNRANNHDFDGGLAGMYSTDAILDQAGIVHAGTGKDLNEARSAHYLATPKGRVGLVGFVSFDDSSTFGTNFHLTEASNRGVSYTGGAPGEDALNLTTNHIVTPEQLQSLRSIRDAAYGNSRAARTGNAGPDRLKFFDEWYEAGPNPGALSYTMNPNDERGILQAVRNGKMLSDFMIVSAHVHQTTTFATQGTGSGADPTPPDFLIKMAHECIDNGADIFVAQGIHNLRGVEIYKGKPIFYDLSAFVFQRALQYGVVEGLIARGSLNTGAGADVKSLGIDQEALMATSHYEGGRLVEVRLYPVDMGSGERPLSQVGIPMTPSPEMAHRVLEEVQTISKGFGTNIVIENNIGIIRVSPSADGASGGQ